MSPTEKPKRALQIAGGPVGIFWDMENCRIPKDVSPNDVAVNIRMILRLHPLISGTLISFTAYGDFNGFSRRHREACQRTGVKLVDVPNTHKDAADKAILVDLFLFALDHSPPSTILLISGDVDFANALHVLSQRGYTVIVAAPVSASVSPALRNAGHFLWDWPAVARGDTTISTKFDSFALPAEDEIWLVQPRDLDGFRKQVVRLLEAAGGSLSLIKIPLEYSKMYGPHSSLLQHGTEKLISLLGSMGDLVSVIGEGETRMVVLRQDEGKSISSKSVASDLSISRVKDEIQSVQSGDLEGLKKQVVRLLKEVGGSLQLVKFLEYLKMNGTYGRRQLRKLHKLLAKMGDVVTIVGEGENKVVVLRQVEHVGSSCSENNIDYCTSAAKDDAFHVQPGDLEGLKKRIVKLLRHLGGSLLLVKLPTEYARMYIQPLSLEDYGAENLNMLVDRIGDVITVRGEGKSRVMVLQQEEEGGSSSSCGAWIDCSTTAAEIKMPFTQPGDLEGLKKQMVRLLKEEGGSLPLVKLKPAYTKMYGVQLRLADYGGCKLGKLLETMGDVICVVGEGTDKVVVLLQGEEISFLMEKFRQEVEELLVCYYGRILLSDFVTIYEQRYRRVLDYERFSVAGLEGLVEKVSDIVVLEEDAGTGRKFLVLSSVSR